MRRGCRSAALLFAATLLAGCLPAPAPAPVADPAAVAAAWQTRQAALAGRDRFSLLGRLAVKGGGLSGQLRWDQEGAGYRLRLAGPLGAGALKIEGDGRETRIQGRDIDLVTTEPEQVLATRTGWMLPLAALRWWVLGLPEPGEPADLQLDGEGRLTGLVQRGWTLRFEGYDAQTPALPALIEARRGEAQATLRVETLTLR